MLLLALSRQKPVLHEFAAIHIKVHQQLVQPSLLVNIATVAKIQILQTEQYRDRTSTVGK